MLRSIKSALNAPAAPVDSAGEQRKRKEAKEREAMAGAAQEAPAAGQRARLSFRQLVSQMPSKKLGSKRLANVVNRIKLIAPSKRAKRLAALQGEEAARELEQAARDESAEAEDCADRLSFHSALDYFVWPDSTPSAIERCAGLVGPPPAPPISTTEGHFDGYLADSKYILPEEQCDIPTFLRTENCERQLIEETRRLLRARQTANPDSFYPHDYERMLNDDWTVTRFLLRRRLDPKRTAKLMEECGKFRKQHLMSEIKLWEFPREFHQAGGLFQYLPDRVGNQTLFMRVKMYRRVPEISDVFKAFILCVLERCDAANGGRGTAIIFDLTGCGLQNVDLGFLYWLLNSFRNYCPKGVSYILVYNLPWFLSATCKLAMTWLSETNRRSLRFVSGAEIENFIAREHLPDYLGGVCKQNYRKIPRGSQPAIEVCERLDISPHQALKIKELFQEYLNDEVEEEEEEEADDDEESNSVYGELQAHDAHPNFGANSKSSVSQASTALMNDSADQPLSRPLARSASADSLVPVVNLVSKASKFVAL